MIDLKRSKQEKVSYKMSRVRSKETEIEKIMGRALWASGLRGYRKNQKGVYGTPDFCWKKRKIAIFCDSSFWHGYNWQKERKKITVRKKFRIKKKEDNIKRDKRVTTLLKKEGWRVFRFWDFSIKKDISKCVEKIARAF